jgi:hypothetical protein
VAGIAPGEMVAEYHRRGLDGWSDARLVGAVAARIARPRRDPADSFVLHAPLELAARAALLPHVAAPARERARLQILAVAAQYEAFGPAVARDGEPGRPGADDEEATGKLLGAVRAGDPDGAGTAAALLARHVGDRELVTGVGDDIVPLTSAAAHAPIFLYHVLQRDPRGPISSRLLPPLARELARNPGWRIRWIDGRDAPARGSTEQRATDVAALVEAVGRAPSRPLDGPAFIHPLLVNVDASGVAASRLEAVVGGFDPRAGRALLRVAAQSMVFDDPAHAPYGWTHCLTIPQAVLGLAPFLRRPDQALAVAATHVLAFRTALGAVDLPLHESPAALDLPDADPSRLVNAAATAHDAHIVKYVLACLDAAGRDPEAARLHHAAADRLLRAWEAQGGDPSDPLPAQLDLAPA